MKKLYFPLIIFVFIAFPFAAFAQNVGIGEPVPSTKFEVKGDSGTDLFNVKDQSDDSKLYIQNNGNVGIGTLSPDAKLHVNGEVHLNTMLTHQSEGILKLGRVDGVDRFHLIKAYNSSTTANNYLSFSLHNGTVGATDDVLTLKGDAKVGIGIASPTSELDVNGNIRVRALGAGYVQSDASGNFSVTSTIDWSDITNIPGDRWNGPDNTTGDIDRSGNVGIGAASPGEKLFVNGTVRADDHISLSSGNGKGFRFWNSNNYKISMGNTSEYQYGNVSDYSIKFSMNNDATRGWTWGVDGNTPVAAMNTQGNLELASDLTVNGDDIYSNGHMRLRPGGYIDLRPSDSQHGLILRNYDGSSTDWGGVRAVGADRMEFRM
ncbi:MAG: hypothetical protein WD334_08865, partial [Chitinophagales bacterium]